jgi:cell division protein FtsB
VNRRLAGGVVVVLIALGLAVYGSSSLVRVLQMRAEMEAMEKDVAALRRQTDQLAATVERLRTDPSFVEKLAREDLGLVREGDTVLKFPSQGR